MLYAIPFKRLLLGAALAFGLLSTVQAGDLQPLRVANQKSTIKALLEASGESQNVPYEIKWSEFPRPRPGRSAECRCRGCRRPGRCPYVFALGAGASIKVISIIHAEGRNTTALLVPRIHRSRPRPISRARKSSPGAAPSGITWRSRP